MSTPLFKVHNQVRKRAGFKASADETSNDGDRILDEQGTANLWRAFGNPRLSVSGSDTIEQDEFIDDIRHQMVKSDREHQVGIGIIAILSCVL